MYRTARKLEKLIAALEREAFWDLKIVPPSRQDIRQATDVVQDALILVDERMKKADVDFRRYLVFQDNKETNPDTLRNSNKYLVIVVMVDPDTGLFGAGCAGGRMGNRPKLYQIWGVSDSVNTLKRKFEPYINKKTGNRRDSYTELPESEVF